MDEENHAFLRDDLSKAVREVVYEGRVMLAMEKSKNRPNPLNPAMSAMKSCS